MAFDFLGSPKLEELTTFKTFLQEELETIDQKIVSIKANIDRLKLLREKALSEFSARKMVVPKDFGGEREVIGSNDESEVHIFDAYAAKFMLEAKQPVVEAIKYKQENLENYIKRVFFSIDKEERRLEDLQKGREDILNRFAQAEGLINKFNLIRKEKKNESTTT